MATRWVHWSRFGLRSILILTTVVAAVCGLGLRQAFVQRDVCNRLKELKIELQFGAPWWPLRWLPTSALSLGDGHYFCPVEEVDLRAGVREGDALALVCQLPSLKRLKIYWDIVDPQEFSHLVNCGRLSELDLSNCNIDDDTVERIPRLPSLRTLSLGRNEKITGKNVNSSRFPNLESLECSSTSVTDEALEEIGSIRTLKSLSLSCTCVTDKAIEVISRLQAMKSLDVQSTRVTGVGLAALPQLESLSVADTDLSDAGLQEIGKLRKLKMLDMSECVFITDEGIRALAQHPGLENITASKCGITDTCLDSLATIEQLTELWLADTDVRSLAKLSACKRLSSLTLSSSEVHVEDALGFAKHSDFSLHIRDPRMDENEAVMFSCFGVFVRDWLTNDELASMAGIGVGGNSEHLKLEGFVGLSAKHFRNLYCNVRVLSLARSKVASDLFPCLKEFPLLAELDLSDCPVSAADLEVVGELTTLTSLDLDSTDIDDEGIRKLESLVGLSILRLKGTKVTQGCNGSLSQLKQLSSLTIPYVPDAAGLIELLENCPQLGTIECELPGAQTAEILSPDGLKLRDIDATAIQLRRLHELIQARGNELRSIAGNKLRDEHCEVIAGFPSVGILDFSGSAVTDSGIAKLAKLMELDTLNLSQTEVSAEGIRALKEHHVLRSLTFEPKLWSVELAESLLELQQVSHLQVCFSEMPRDVALVFAKGACRNDSLNCSECSSDIEDELVTQFLHNRIDLAWLAGEESFKEGGVSLTLAGALVDDARIAEVIGSPAIRFVRAQNLSCSTASLMGKLLECSAIRCLHLRGVSLSPEDMEQFGNFSQLVELQLDHCELTGDHLAKLAVGPRLLRLSIAEKRIDVIAMVEMVERTKLRTLMLNAECSVEDCSEFKRRLGRRCEVQRAGRW